MKHLLSFLLATLALAGGPSIAVLAAETSAVAPADLSEIRDLEEIVVTGDRTLSAAREAIVEAEDRFYNRYNELNTDDKFDIKCRMQEQGSKFRVRVCIPRYVEEGTHAEAMKLLMPSSVGGAVMLASSETVGASLRAELKKRTLDLVRKDPELMRALLERARLEQYYQQLRKEKFKNGKWIVWD